jgi:hypothetical protein
MHLGSLLFAVCLASTSSSSAAAQATLAIDTAAARGKPESIQPLEKLPAEALLLRFQGGERGLSGHSGERFEVLGVGEEFLVGGLGSGGEELLEVELDGGTTIPLSIEHLRQLRHPTRAAGLPLERPKEGDRLWRARGSTVERVDGALLAFAGDALVFEGDKVGELVVPFVELVALSVEGLGGEPVKQTGQAGLLSVDLRDGSRVRGELSALDARRLVLRREARELALPIGLVSQALVLDGRARWLSALPPVDARPARPFGDEAGMSWAPRMDRNSAGGPLSCGGEPHARGVGLLSGARVEWELDGRPARLRALCGLDDGVQSLPLSPVARAVVEVDGKVLWDSGPLAAGAPPVALDLDLGAARRVALVALDHDGDFAGDRVDWASALLIQR